MEIIEIALNLGVTIPGEGYSSTRRDAYAKARVSAGENINECFAKLRAGLIAQLGETAGAPVQEEKTTSQAPVAVEPEVKAEEAAVAETPPAPEPAKEMTLQDFRHRCARIMDALPPEEIIKDLGEKFGANRLSEVKAADYQAVVDHFSNLLAAKAA